MSAVFLVVEVFRRRGRLAWTRTAVLAAIVFATALAAISPILVLYSREHAAVVQATTSATFDLYTFSARISAYLVPSPRNPLFHWVADTHPSDLTEETLYPSYTMLALALVAVVLAARRSGWFSRDERRVTVFTLAALALVAFVWSLPPTYHVAGLTVSTPSRVTEVLAPMYRVYSRFGVLVDFAVIALAALGLSALVARGGRWRLATPLAAILVFLEILPGNVPALDARAAPAWVAWLQREPRGIVATYPVTFLGQDTWWQTLDRDPQFDVVGNARQYDPAQREEGIRLLAGSLSAPLTAEILSSEGVRYVVVHDDTARRQRTIPAGSFSVRARFGTVGIYSVHAPRTNIQAALDAHAQSLNLLQHLVGPTPTYGSGFNAPELYLGSPARWMIQDGQLEFANDSGPMKLTLFGEAFSSQTARVLELVGPSGRVLERTTVPTNAVRLQLGPFIVPHGNSTFTLTASPGPETLAPSDPRQASVFIGSLVETHTPTYVDRVLSPSGAPAAR
jgi:hypothetical protein